MIVVSCQDTMMFKKNILKNPNVIYIFDHLKISSFPNYFYLNNDIYSHSQYLLMDYYNKQNTNIIDCDAELKDLYIKKTMCTLKTSKIFSRLFENSSKPIFECKYDISFVGTVDYGINNTITSHRKDLILKLKEITIKNNLNVYLGESNEGDKIPLHKYHRILKNTKIFISP